MTLCGWKFQSVTPSIGCIEYQLATMVEYLYIGYHGGVHTITFLGNQPSFNNYVALEILTWE